MQLEILETIIKIPQKILYICYIWQSVCEISEIWEPYKLGFHDNEYPP